MSRKQITITCSSVGLHNLSLVLILCLFSSPLVTQKTQAAGLYFNKSFRTNRRVISSFRSDTNVISAVAGDRRITKVADTDDGICDEDCSLREAVATASDNEIITFDTTAFSTADHIVLTLGELRVRHTLTIVGTNMSESRVTVGRNSFPAPAARIIFNTGTLTLINMIITGGTAPGDFGGGIFNSGTLTLINTEVTGNSALGGGGIENRGTLNATNSTISDNTTSHPSARTQGGGIANSGMMTLINTTISNNQATSGDLVRYGGSGGGIYHRNGTATLRNVTIANNTAVQEYGGGLYVNSGTVNLGNTLVADNSAGSSQNGPDIWGTVNSEGFNLIGGSPLLDPNGLRSNGGATRTIALQQNSPAVDKGNGTIAGITTDQRGFTRPVDNPLIPNALGGDGSDIGAFEVQGGPIISINNASLNEGNNGTSTFTFTVSLSASSNQTVTVNFATANGTATVPEDYQAASGELFFASGETIKQVAVLVNGDQEIESNETFTVSLTNATNATISVSAGQGIGTIQNDDIAGSLQFSSTNFSVSEGSGVAVITVTRTGGNGGGVSVIYASQNGTAIAGQDYTTTSGTVTFGANETSKTFSIPIINDTTVEPTETVNLALFNASAGGTIGLPDSATLSIIDDDTTSSTVQFTAASYVVTEDAGSATVTVNRFGNNSGVATVDYATSDLAGLANCNVLNSGYASSRCDYTTTIGRLRFGAGETSKNISVLVVDDGYGEGNEQFNITLSNAVGESLGVPSTATVTIIDNETVNGVNPINQAGFFAREHYLDFFSREPDAIGLAFWTNEITSCGTDTACIELRRINVSAAFFLSIEFQQTGYLVYRMYKAAYGNLPGGAPVPVRFNEFLPDTQQIGLGVVVGQTGWEQVLENNKNLFAADFVARSPFTAAHQTTLTPAQFVDRLFVNAGVIPLAAERDAAIGEFGGAVNTVDTAARGRALRRVAENPALAQQEFNTAFVLMQYFGYLRRNPNDAPEPGLNFDGYNFWLGKLNQFNGNFVNAEMVKAFIVSGEYQQRFGP